MLESHSLDLSNKGYSDDKLIIPKITCRINLQFLNLSNNNILEISDEFLSAIALHPNLTEVVLQGNAVSTKSTYTVTRGRRSFDQYQETITEIETRTLSHEDKLKVKTILDAKIKHKEAVEFLDRELDAFLNKNIDEKWLVDYNQFEQKIAELKSGLKVELSGGRRFIISGHHIKELQKKYAKLKSVQDILSHNLQTTAVLRADTAEVLVLMARVLKMPNHAQKYFSKLILASFNFEEKSIDTVLIFEGLIKNISCLSFEGIAISKELAEKIALAIKNAGINSRLDEIELKDCTIKDDALDILFAMDSQVKKFTCAQTKVNAMPAFTISEDEIHLSSIKLGQSDALVAQTSGLLVRKDKLNKLSLRNVKISLAQFEILIQGLKQKKNSVPVELALTENTYNEEFASVLIEVSHLISSFNIGGTIIYPGTIQSIEKIFTGLQKLGLSRCTVDERAVAGLVNIIKTNPLIELDLSRVVLNTRALKSLIEISQTIFSLTTLRMAGISNESGQVEENIAEICVLLEGNSSLKLLDLTGVKLSEVALKRLTTSLREHNTTLAELKLDSPSQEIQAILRRNQNFSTLTEKQKALDFKLSMVQAQLITLEAEQIDRFAVDCQAVVTLFDELEQDYFPGMEQYRQTISSFLADLVRKISGIFAKFVPRQDHAIFQLFEQAEQIRLSSVELGFAIDQAYIDAILQTKTITIQNFTLALSVANKMFAKDVNNLRIKQKIYNDYFPQLLGSAQVVDGELMLRLAKEEGIQLPASQLACAYELRITQILSLPSVDCLEALRLVEAANSDGASITAQLRVHIYSVHIEQLLANKHYIAALEQAEVAKSLGLEVNSLLLNVCNAYLGSLVGQIAESHTVFQALVIIDKALRYGLNIDKQIIKTVSEAFVDLCIKDLDRKSVEALIKNLMQKNITGSTHLLQRYNIGSIENIIRKLRNKSSDAQSCDEACRVLKEVLNSIRPEVGAHGSQVLVGYHAIITQAFDVALIKISDLFKSNPNSVQTVLLSILSLKEVLKEYSELFDDAFNEINLNVSKSHLKCLLASAKKQGKTNVWIKNLEACTDHNSLISIIADIIKENDKLLIGDKALVKLLSSFKQQLMIEWEALPAKSIHQKSTDNNNAKESMAPQGSPASFEVANFCSNAQQKWDNMLAEMERLGLNPELLGTIPDEILCSITHQIMDQPLMACLAESDNNDVSANTYEGKALSEHLRTKNTDPLNGEKLSGKCQKNQAVVSMRDKFLAQAQQLLATYSKENESASTYATLVSTVLPNTASNNDAMPQQLPNFANPIGLDPNRFPSLPTDDPFQSKSTTSSSQSEVIPSRIAEYG